MRWLLLAAVCAILIPSGPGSAGELLDFSGATVVAPSGATSLETRAVQVLREEIEKRTGLTLGRSNRWPGGSGPIIVVGTRERLSALRLSLGFQRETPAPGAEGYTVAVRGETPPVVVVAGEDPRGVLYGVGRLLRTAVWSTDRLLLPSELQISTAPKYPIRGHQLGNRDVNNTYDAWAPEQFDAYIRDLALFGANSIELIPPFVADYPTDHSQRVLPSDEMMPHIVDAIDAYGMDVWIFYPSIEEGADEWDDPGDEAFSDPAFIRKELERADRFFGGVKRLDALFVPGGDPGVLSPEVLFSWLEELAPVLQKHHPAAKIWVSDQFGVAGRSWYDTFIEEANRAPAWLGGVAVGPGGGTSIPEMRRRVDPSVPIRHYVDITHIVPAQYPIPTYDRAFFLTLGREPPIPRPRAFKHIHNLYDEHTAGALAYSEGVNDDVNKFVWLDQGWDPETPVIETLRDYARVFIDPGHTEQLAQGFFALEENLNGVLAENPQIETTLHQWRALEAEAPPEVLSNWRFQLGLIRAYYDALIKMRLFQDRHLEYEAREALARAPQDGALTAMERAERLLKKTEIEPVGQEHEARCRELADRLREGIGIQMSVERHGAVRSDRGAIIDAIDYPLNDAPWLLDQMERARQLGSEPARREAIEKILNRTNPGPGGFYDDFGSEASLRRVVAPGQDWESDPATYRSVFRRFEFGGQWLQKGPPIPLAWLSHLAVNFDQPLSVRYQDLDPEASYRIRVVHGRHPPSRLEADGHLVYDFDVTGEGPVLERPVPVEATRDGEVVFSWTASPENRRTTVAEVVLIREEAFPLWGGGAIPKAADIPVLQNVWFSVVKPNEPELDGYRFQHEPYIEWHKGKLYVSWVRSKEYEFHRAQEAGYRFSEDGGRTWSEVMPIGSSDYAYVTVVLKSMGDRLWAFAGTSTQEDVPTAPQAYVLDEATSKWIHQGALWEGTDTFWPESRPIRMADGNWIMSGHTFVLPSQDKGHEDFTARTVIVAISHGDDLTRWDRVVVPAASDGKQVGESTVMDLGERLMLIIRYHPGNRVALVSLSEDFGRTWSTPVPSNLPMTPVQPSSGLLSTGHHYLLTSGTCADNDGRRHPLTISLTRPGEGHFSKLRVIRHSEFPEGPGESPAGTLHHGTGIEHEDQLWVVYSNGGNNRVGEGRQLWNNNSIEMAVIPLESLLATQ